jgi:glycosyltransferase involved in cell wall biosynthesis
MPFVCNGHDFGLIRWALKYLCEAIKREGVNCYIVDLAKGDNPYWQEGVDVAMFYRCFDLQSLHLMRKLKREGKFVMFFLDDYLFQPNCKYTPGWVCPMEPMNESDALVSSSERLLTHMPDKPRIFRRSVMDYESMALLKQEYRRTPGEFNIGWLGGMGRRGMMDRFVYDMLRILDPMIPSGMKCTFNLFGPRDYPPFPRISVKEHLYVRTTDWKELYAKFVSFDMGAMINPLDESDEFCHCKSDLKYHEAGVMGVPMIVSRISPYAEFVKEGVNGLFASTPEEFAEKLALLMRDEVLSREISKATTAYTVENCDVQKNAQRFLADVEAAIKKTQQARVQQHFGAPLRKPF